MREAPLDRAKHINVNPNNINREALVQCTTFPPSTRSACAKHIGVHLRSKICVICGYSEARNREALIAARKREAYLAQVEKLAYTAYMRITGGKYGGRIIEVEQGKLEIRPAMDRMRESVFSILGDLTGHSFLDIFAGSGILGLEAASRGAKPVTCVERDRAKFPQLLKNVSLAEEHIECKAMPAELFLERTKEKYDLIFLDPPFPYKFKSQLLHSIGKRGLCNKGGRVLMHLPREEKITEVFKGLTKYDERDYGRSLVIMYHSEPSDE